MYLPKHYKFDKYVLIFKDTSNEHTWDFKWNLTDYDYAQKVEEMKD